VRVWAKIAERSRADPVSVTHVCAAAVAGVGVDGAAVTVMASSAVRETVHATDQTAADLEDWQLTLGQGPGVDAFTNGGPVLAPDLDSPRDTDRWPVFAPQALTSGTRALFALPLQVGAIRLGVLELYRASPGPLSQEELADALVFADAAGMVLLDSPAIAPPDATEMAWLTDDPTAHQAQVHQATGMVLAQLGVSAETAFARLRAHAYAYARPLGDVARDVVERRLRFEPD
jgi:hypothetical protein